MSSKILKHVSELKKKLSSELIIKALLACLIYLPASPL